VGSGKHVVFVATKSHRGLPSCHARYRVPLASGPRSWPASAMPSSVPAHTGIGCTALRHHAPVSASVWSRAERAGREEVLGHVGNRTGVVLTAVLDM
jgi:hypothetical protein